MALSLFVVTLAGCTAPEESKDATPVPDYEIMAEEDQSFANVVRFTYRVVVASNLTQNSVLAAAKAIKDEKIDEVDVNALGFFFYEQGTDWESSYTKAAIDWAPYGDWSRAGEVPPGQYRNHEFSVEGFYP